MPSAATATGTFTMATGHSNGSTSFSHPHPRHSSFYGEKRGNSAQTANSSLIPISFGINYDLEVETIKLFLQEYRSNKLSFFEGVDDEEIAMAKALNAFTNLRDESTSTIPKYLQILQSISNMESSLIEINLEDIIEWNKQVGTELTQHINQNTFRYVQLFEKAIDSLLPLPSTQKDHFTSDNQQSDHFPLPPSPINVNEIINTHRRAKFFQLQSQKNHNLTMMGGDSSLAPPLSTSPLVPKSNIPDSLTRTYQVVFRPFSSTPIQSVREISSNQVGNLIVLKGIITKIGEVKPLLLVGAYSCERCGSEAYQEISSQVFMPPLQCPSPKCITSNNNGQLILQSRGSKFIRFQEARIQELADQVPIGHIPRSMSVHFEEDLTRKVGPGDHVIISGIFMPRPYQGFRAVKAGLLTDTFLLSQHVIQIKQKYKQLSESMDSPLTKKIQLLSQDPKIIEKLTNSIAPEIYGHSNVKEALLLMMVAGVTKEMADGMKIRGDINVCLMGDPGVAKSQLLKFISKIAPRAIYTTGKGSSGVGLTASISKDPITNEMILEGGALVLSDNGICAIDEFDKMDEYDRTAIHEVMEQQTISISKAGINTTLNARTAILAAANPLYGRYNPKKSPRENINLPPALLSRFDLLFLILDNPNMEQDTKLAQHICQVHRTGESPSAFTFIQSNSNLKSIENSNNSNSNNQENQQSDNADNLLVDIDTLRAYIGVARTFEPLIPLEGNLTDKIVSAYIRLRLDDLDHRDTTYTTPRTLLALIRLSQALAKLHFRNMIEAEDIEEALRLIQISRNSVEYHLVNGRGGRFKKRSSESDPVIRIYGIIKDMLSRKQQEEEHDKWNQDRSNSNDNGNNISILSMDSIREAIRTRGMTDDQLQKCLVEFDQCNIWSISEDGTMLKFY